ncbi:hypothetical protein ACFY1A_17060 [Streptomyces sp. NPDC001520]|uniref:hypothetical protein n=1 Tax=unclassified Streptomyces TaxID=2593676 RepID=UPI00369718EF
MEQLVLAGAPELPEGWFYRMREVYGVGFKVEIRERTRFASRQVAEKYVLERGFDDMADAVVDACLRARRSAATQAEMREKWRALSRFVGDHDGRRHG